MRAYLSGDQHARQAKDNTTTRSIAVSNAAISCFTYRPSSDRTEDAEAIRQV